MAPQFPPAHPPPPTFKKQKQTLLDIKERGIYGYGSLDERGKGHLELWVPERKSNGHLWQPSYLRLCASK